MPLPSKVSRDHAVCAAILRRGSKSFALAGLLLPGPLRRDAAAVYAFCRQADDAIDNLATPPNANTPAATTAVALAVAALYQRLDAIYGQGLLTDPVDRALADVVRRHQLPRDLFAALLEGFAWDGQGRRYESLSDVVAYSVRVAGSVGAIMTLLMGQRDPIVLARACDLGVAMQLTNIARDVAEDAARGRVYLPAQWLFEYGMDVQTIIGQSGMIADTGVAQAVFKTVERLLDTADALYRRADAGIPYLPARCRVAIAAARWIYSDIGRLVRIRGVRALRRRAVVSSWRKALCLVMALKQRWRRRDPCAVAAPVLPEAQTLLHAASVAA